MLAAPPPPLSDRALWRAGVAALAFAFALGLGATALALAHAPEQAWVVGALAVGAAGAVWLFRHPLANLYGILAAVSLTTSYEPGIQWEEAFYLLYYLAFLAAWFPPRLADAARRAEMLRGPADRALFAFLVLAALTAPLTVLFGGSVRDMASEGFAVSMLALYFPVREACVRHRHGAYVVLAGLMTVVLYVGVNNIVQYQETIARAIEAWQVTRGRAAGNDTLLLAGSCFTLFPLLYARAPRRWALWAAGFAFSFAGLLITQSRGYWAAFLIGVLAAALLLDRGHRVRLGLYGAAALALLVGVAFWALGDVATLIVEGFVNRFTSTGTAAMEDESLINRFRESAAVLDRIARNPVIGHGMGVTYRFFDLTFAATRVDTFIHNGYLALWFKFGIAGLGLMVFFLTRTIVEAARAVRRPAAPPVLRVFAASGVASVLAMMVAANTSNPFHLNDMTFTIALVTGLGGAAAAWERAPERQRYAHATTPDP